MGDCNSEWSNSSRRQSGVSSPTDVCSSPTTPSLTEEASTLADLTLYSLNQGENGFLQASGLVPVDDTETLVQSNDGRKSMVLATVEDVPVEIYQDLSIQPPDVENIATGNSSGSAHPLAQQLYQTPVQTHAPRFNPPRPLPPTPDSGFSVDHADSSPSNVIAAAPQETDDSGHDIPTSTSPPPSTEPADLEQNGPTSSSLTQNPDVQDPHPVVPHVSTVPHTPLSTPPPPFPPIPSPQHPSPRMHVPNASLLEEYGSLLTHLDPQTNRDYIPFSLGEDHWRQYTHPNGSLYWTCPSRRVVMDDSPSPGTVHSLHTLIAQLEDMDDIEHWELYISTKSRHFIHHGSRSMSKDGGLLELFEQMDRARSNIQSKLELESRYWMFVQTHPNHVIVPGDADHDAEDAILWCYADRRLFDSSHAPFEKDTAQEMFSILQILSSRSRVTLKTWFVAAILRSVVQERIASRYGTENARGYRQLEKAEEVPDFPPLSSSWRIVLWNAVAVSAFGAPFSYLKRIVNVDRSNGISTIRWQAFVRTLCAEWTDSNLLSVVLVSGTVAMLSVQGLTGMAQMTAFYSTFCALSAVLTGTLLISSHRSRIESNGRSAYLYFDFAKRMTGSPHILAIILSLPLTLTLWGMLWFTVSAVSLAYSTSFPTSHVNYQGVLRITSISFSCALVGVVMIMAWFFRAQRGFDALWRGPHVLRSALPLTEHHALPSPPDAPRGRLNEIQMMATNSSSPSTFSDSGASQVRRDVYHPYIAPPLDFGFVPGPHSFMQRGIDVDVELGDREESRGFHATPVPRLTYQPPIATPHARFAPTTSFVARAVHHPPNVYRPHGAESRTTRIPYHSRSKPDLSSLHATPPVIPTLHRTPSSSSLPPSYSSTNVASPPAFLPTTAAQVLYEPVMPMLSQADVPACTSPDASPSAHQTLTSLPLPSITATSKNQSPNSLTGRLYPRITLRPNDPYGPKLGTPTYRPSPLGPNRHSPRTLPPSRPMSVLLPWAARRFRLGARASEHPLAANYNPTEWPQA